MKILFCASIDTHIKSFHLPTINKLHREGNDIDIASNGDSIFDNVNNKFNVKFSRNPFSFDNVIAYFQLRKILKNKHYDIISTHTPIPSFLIRFAARNSKSKVIYMAHGFHFYRSDSKIAGKPFYYAEKAATKYTDTLITINKEDFEAAQQFHLRNNSKSIFLTKGVGIDLTRFSNYKHKDPNLLNSFHLNDNSVVLSSVGELNINKNHIFVLESLVTNNIFIKHPNLVYLICGKGPLMEEYNLFIKNNNLQNRVFLLGYRNDIERILAISDIFVFPSLREGLPTSIIEAMASGLPVIASRIRGNTDLIDEKVNGFTYPLGNSCEFIDKLNILLEDNELLLQLSSNNINKSTQYDKDLLAERLVEIYKI